MHKTLGNKWYRHPKTYIDILEFFNFYYCRYQYYRPFETVYRTLLISTIVDQKVQLNEEMGL